MLRSHNIHLNKALAVEYTIYILYYNIYIYINLYELLDIYIFTLELTYTIDPIIVIYFY